LAAAGPITSFRTTATFRILQGLPESEAGDREADDLASKDGDREADDPASKEGDRDDDDPGPLLQGATRVSLAEE
jgi:hypothetical protein